MEEGRYARLRALGGIAFVSLPPSEYASALEATLRTGRCELVELVEDGVCVCFLHGGELYLRTARGAVKGVVDMGAFSSMECVVMSPVVSSGFSTREAGRSDGSIYYMSPVVSSGFSTREAGRSDGSIYYVTHTLERQRPH